MSRSMRVPRKGSESPLNLARGAIECTDLMRNFKDAKMRMLPNNGRRKKLQRQRLKKGLAMRQQRKRLAEIQRQRLRKGLAMRQQRKRLAELPNDLQFNAHTVEGLTGRAHVKKIS